MLEVSLLLYLFLFQSCCICVIISCKDVRVGEGDSNFKITLRTVDTPGEEKDEYLIRQKFVGQKCRNSSLMSKILSDETFCPSKILSNISIEKSGKKCKIWAWCCNFCPVKFCPIRYFCFDRINLRDYAIILQAL